MANNLCLGVVKKDIYVFCETALWLFNNCYINCMFVE